MSIATSLPESFIASIEQGLGPESELFFKSLHHKSPVSIRINPTKGTETEGLEPVSWSKYGFYLPERPVFTLDPLFHSGCYYVQEASSMFLEQIFEQFLDLKQPLKVLDLCAAPGGKSTHIASLLSKDSLLVSNEVLRSRAVILAENLTKWGTPNVIVTNNDPSAFRRLPGFFDVVVVDAPCSGEGMFRKDTDAVGEWSEENIKLCAARQRRIVADVWDALAPGGLLVYSTCTYNRQENEENIDWMIREMGATPLFADISKFPDVVQASNLPGFHFYPHRIKGEGFFISALKKNDGSRKPIEKIKKPSLALADRSTEKEISPWIDQPGNFDFWLFHEKILAFPAMWHNEILTLVNQFAITRCGTEVGEIKAKNILLSPALALSSILNQAAFRREETDLETALRFLKKEDVIPVASDQYILLSYKGCALGWLKKAGKRYNNLYPKEWRIRMNI